MPGRVVLRKEGRKTLTLTGKAGEKLALPETPVREGYNLADWNPALPEKYPEKDTEYTAEWVKEGDYNITYVNVEGATNENPQSYNVETETITLKDPAKPGYTFAGWYKDAEFTTQVTEITQGTTGNITLYAKWVKEGDYTITYVLDGGTNAPENPPSYNVETETITLKDPAKPGYTFGGWYRTEDFTGNAVTEIIQGTTGNITLYAKWELVSYTITYELNGGTNVPENPAGYNVETGTITLKAPTKDGFAFTGWFESPDFSTTEVKKITRGSTGDKTLYARWIQSEKGQHLAEGGKCTLNHKEVTLSSFWISKYEVTQEEFVSVMTGNQNGIEANPSRFTSNPAAGEVQERRPVEKVSWYDAIVYCNLLSIKEGLIPCYTIKGSTAPADWGTSPTSISAEDYDDWESVTCNFDAGGYRLPTEAEWEYAARGGKAGITDGSWEYEYSGSDNAGDVAWLYEYEGKTHEVGKKQANALGLYDMSGNVWEWCWDWDGSSSDYPSGTEDPAGPDTGSYRMSRGGSWNDLAWRSTVSNRDCSHPPCSRGNKIGFRLVRSAR